MNRNFEKKKNNFRTGERKLLYGFDQIWKKFYIVLFVEVDKRFPWNKNKFRNKQITVNQIY